ncbi:hypothetical protein DFH08DRAFT_817500 [Mycena albidolilacea]|uniref:Uncharacterized protein n=1 Tax=Mycena albidolilacea TaxID=1033008 RepID=A0AAD6ZJM3_9AGAR|nr:hypothetical protein DFH08DRAFT_817500 [Mycena albidolilacea]
MSGRLRPKFWVKLAARCKISPKSLAGRKSFTSEAIMSLTGRLMIGVDFTATYFVNEGIPYSASESIQSAMDFSVDVFVRVSSTMHGTSTRSMPLDEIGTGQDEGELTAAGSTFEIPVYNKRRNVIPQFRIYLSSSTTMLISLRARSESWDLDPRIYPRVILGLIIPGLGLTIVLLALFGYAAWNIVSRRYLDRYVDPRNHVYATHHASLVFGVSLSFSSLGGYTDWRCSLLSFLTNSTIMFPSCIFFCMALNVPLVVVYKISGQAMEKYYVAGTILICLICNIPPYASGNLGHVLIPTETRLRWVTGTQSSWIIIFAVGELGAFLIILGYLVTHEVGLSIARIPRVVTTQRQLHLLCRPAHTGSIYSSEGAGSTILKFRNIILRIGLYPLISCLLNVTGTGISVYASREYKMEAFELTKLDTILMLVSIANCAGRPLIYGLVAATDPSFIRAIRALRHPDSETETQFCRSGCLSTIVVMPPHVISFDDGGAVDNDHGQQERMRAIAPGSDLEGGKKSLWRSYFTITSGTTKTLSMSSRASTLPAVDIVSHI